MYGIYDNNMVIARFVAPITVRNNKPTLLSDTLSLKRHTRKSSAQRWEIDTELEPLMVGAEQLLMNVLLAGLHTKIEVVFPQLPSISLNRDYITGPLTVTSDCPIGATAIRMATGIKVGSYIKFSRHDKVYIVIQNTGDSFKIYPPLRKAVKRYSNPTLEMPEPVWDTVAYEDDVLMKCYYDTGTVSGMVFTDGILMNLGAVKLVEAL